MGVMSWEDARQRREREEDERRVRRALKEASDRVKPADWRRLGFAMATIYEALREAAKIDSLQRGDCPGPLRSRWGPIERAVDERDDNAAMRRSEIEASGDDQIVFLVSAMPPEVTRAEAVMGTFHRWAVKEGNPRKLDQRLRDWKILLELALRNGKSCPSAAAIIAKRHGKSEAWVSDEKNAALGRILVGVRNLLPLVDIPKKRAA